MNEINLESSLISFNIKQFDINKIRHNSVIIMGKRQTGKSFLVRDIMYHNRDITEDMFISNKHDQFLVPKNVLVHSRYDPVFIEYLLKCQEYRIEDKIKDPSAFLVIDGSWLIKDLEDQGLQEIFFNGRRSKLLFLLTAQIPLGIPPMFRQNIDFTFILKNNNESDRTRLYKNYASMFPSQEIFNKVLDSCTEEYHCLVIDNTTTSNKIEDKVFIYKASSHEDFKMG